jgi:hypothetical protein
VTPEKAAVGKSISPAEAQATVLELYWRSQGALDADFLNPPLL